MGLLQDTHQNICHKAIMLNLKMSSNAENLINFINTVYNNIQNYHCARIMCSFWQ